MVKSARPEDQSADDHRHRPAGQELTEHNGEWTNSPTGYTYKWQQCNSSGAGCTTISGATNQTYMPVAGDVGHTIRVEETASNEGGSGSRDLAPTAVVKTGAPVNHQSAGRSRAPPSRAKN